MFDWIRTVLDEARAARRRRADIALLDGLSDRTLADLGIERCDIERTIDRHRGWPRYEARLGPVLDGRFAPCG